MKFWQKIGWLMGLIEELKKWMRLILHFSTVGPRDRDQRTKRSACILPHFRLVARRLPGFVPAHRPRQLVMGLPILMSSRDGEKVLAG